MEVRKALTSGLNRQRLKLEGKRSLKPLSVLVVGTIVGVLGAAYLVTQLSSTLFRPTNQVRFAISDGYGVLPGVDEVRFRGVPAGKISKLQRTHGQIVITADVRKDFGTVYKDAHAQLRPQTPLEDMYLDITDPGHRSAGKAGKTALPESATDTSVNIDDVLSSLNADTRTRLSTLLDQLGNGLQDRGLALRQAVVQLAPFLQGAGRVTDQIAQRQAMTKRLVHNAAELTTELGKRQGELRTLVSEGAATVSTLQQGSRDFNATLTELPPTLSAIQASFKSVSGVLGDVNRAADDLDPVAEKLPDALTALRSLNSSLSPAVAKLQAPVRDLVPLASSLKPFTHDLGSTINALQPQVPAVNKTSDILVRCQKGIVGFFQWNASLSKFGDVRGPIPRGNLAINAPDLGPSVSKRSPGPNCDDGVTIGGRPAEPGKDDY